MYSIVLLALRCFLGYNYAEPD